QVIATAAISVAGFVAFRRFPQHAGVTLGSERRDILSFLGQSTAATAVHSFTPPGAPSVSYCRDLCARAGVTARARPRLDRTPGHLLPSRDVAAAGVCGRVRA